MKTDLASTTSESQPGSLGIYVRNLPPLSDDEKRSNTVRRYILQSAARHLLPDNSRLRACHRAIVSQSRRVTIKYAHGARRAHYGGLAQCVQVWVCPVCTGKVSEKRKLELFAATARAKSLNLRPLLVTYTLRHSFNDKLPDLLKILLGAYRSITQNRPYRRLKQQFGLQGYIRALEVTYHTGWHPHLHVLLFAESRLVSHDEQVVALESELERLWLAMLAVRGGSGLQGIACTVRAGNSFVSDYIAKYGHLPANERWSLEKEITAAAAKRSRGETGFTAFGLLEDYAINGDEVSGSLFVEFAAAMWGKSQLQWSRGLSDLLDMEPAADEQIVENDPPEYEDLMQIDYPTWRAILAAGRRGEVLDKVSEYVGDVARIQAYIDSLLTDERGQGEPCQE